MHIKFTLQVFKTSDSIMDKMYLKEKDFQDYETYEISEKLMKAF